MTSVSPPASRWERVREPVLFTVGLAWMLVVEVKNFLPDDGDPYYGCGPTLIVGLLMQWSGLLVWRRRGTGNLGPALPRRHPLVRRQRHARAGRVDDLPVPRLVRAITRRRGAGLPVGASGSDHRSDPRRHPGRRPTLRGRWCEPSFFDLGSPYFGNDAPPVPDLDPIRREALWQSVGNSCHRGQRPRRTRGCRRPASGAGCGPPGRRAERSRPVLVSGIAIAPMLGWTALTTPVELVRTPVPQRHLGRVGSSPAARGLVPVAVLLGIVRVNAARSSLAELLLELDRGVPVGQLEGVLRRQLHDPSLRLAFPRSGPPPSSTPSGEPTRLPVDGSAAVTQIDDADGAPIAFVIHDPALVRGPALVRAAGARGASEPRERAPPGRGSRPAQRGPGPQRPPRGRVGRRAATARAGPSRRRPAALRHPRAPAERRRDRRRSPTPSSHRCSRDASDELEAGLHDLRELARGIHPAVLTRSGPRPPRSRSLPNDPASPSSVRAPGDAPRPAKMTAYFVIAEALANLARHAAATPGLGRGRLPRGAAPGQRRGRRHRRGRRWIGARASAGSVIVWRPSGGTLLVESPAGGGTTVRAAIPCG